VEHARLERAVIDGDDEEEEKAFLCDLLRGR